MVPLVVIVPPVNPVPAVILVTLPVAAVIQVGAPAAFELNTWPEVPAPAFINFVPSV